ncbi:MAG: hypothetical protein IAI50_08150 [Candidatus Eremiobacteraeota bacterium]|nr:hypothetical protein [Candidatus Eremiobacteraeota bacterium]
MRLWRPLILAALITSGTLTAAAAATSGAALTVAKAPGSTGDALWAQATSAALTRDITHGRPATETTTASIVSDGQFVYVRFSAAQRESIAASQRTNNVGSGTDDEVWVDFWPNGASGYFYQFVATPLGTHYQYSSENTNYEPTWQSSGTVRSGGYTVTMNVPLGAIRGAQGGGGWRAQFVRLVHATGEIQVWTGGSAQTNPDDLAYAGTLTMPPSDVANRPQPRAALYALGTVASKTIGGSTSRSGADLSLPITPTASLYATIHPDFSNVELDQQSISPTAFQRYYSEVRPFFTQGANFYNNLNCDVCPSIQELYTPAIPTPRDGYALEGQQGRLGFGTFDAVGDDRNDLASSFDYTSTDLKWNATLQRVSVTTPTVVDDVTTTGLSYYDRKHVSAYFDYGSDAGTNVLQPDDAQRYDFGGGWGSQTFAAFGSTRKVGDYYDPVDGFVQHPGIAGYSLYSNKLWLGTGGSKLLSFSLGGLIDRYHGNDGALDQTDNTLLFDVLTKSLIDLNISSGSNYLRLADGVFAPVSQNGIGLTYHSGSQNNAGNFGQHGSSATPTSISYNTGSYGDGRLDTWLRSTTMRAGMRGTLTLEVDDTQQRFAALPGNTQWFERLGYAYQLGPDSSFAVGLRRAVGTPPDPNGGGDCIGTCTNVSFSYHVRRRKGELYLGYGDPNTLNTTPQAILKLIYYVGADKGT